jgi:hypothetical protein
VRRDPAGDQVERIVSLAAPVSALRAGDMTGDHIDDLIVLEGDAVTSLVVYPQCTNRDVACLKGEQP